MQTNMKKQISAYTRRGKYRRMWKRMVKMMACVVVFCTAYALILPALTTSDETFCGLEEHVHDESCYTEQPGNRVMICTPERLEIHHHEKSCYDAEGKLICGKADYVLHTHTEDCYDAEGKLVCPLEERSGTVHVHDEQCYTVQRGKLICTLEETNGHTHDESCYDEQGTLICEQEEAPAHHHEESCYEQVRVLSCGMLEVREHIHEDTCFETKETSRELTCGKEEHTHTLACYSNPNADTETPEVWEATLPALSGKRAEDLQAVAESQLGYCESEHNYEVSEDQSLRGYTRYGAWAGDPYGEWSLYFIKFCMHYAGVPEQWYASCSSDAEIRAIFDSLGRLAMPGESEMMPGDLLFLDRGHGTEAGVISKAADGYVTAILGDSSDAVRSESFAVGDAVILSFGRTAEVLTEPEETVPESTAVSVETTIPIETEAPAESTEPVTTEATEEPTVPPETEDSAETTVPSESEVPTETTVPSGTEAPIPNSSDSHAIADLIPETEGAFQTFGAASGKTADMTPMLTEVRLQHRANDAQNWQDITDGMTLPESEQIRCELAYTVPTGTLGQQCNTIVYQIPAGIKLSGAESGDVTDSTGRKVGTYEISESGYMQIHFDAEYVNQNENQPIAGTIHFDGSLNRQAGGNDGTLELVFNDSFKTTIKVTEKEPAKGDVNVTKAGKVTQDGLILYTIEVTSKEGTSGQVTVTDCMEFVTYYADLKVVDQNDRPVTVNPLPNKGDKQFTLTLPAMEQNSKYVITYLAKPFKNVSGGMVENRVTVDSVNTESLPLQGTAEVKTSVDILRKNGEYDPKTGLITWTLTVNAQKADISGWVLKDFITGTGGHREEYTGEFTMKDSAGKEIKDHFPYTFPEGSTDTYTITYHTKAEDVGGSAGVHSILNQAELYKDAELMYDGEKGIGIGVYTPVTKEGILRQRAEDGRLILQWKVRLDLDGLKDGLVEFSDWLPAQEGIEQYMTRDQLLAARKTIEEALRAHNLEPIDWAVFPEDNKDGWNPVAWPENLDPDGRYKGLRYRLQAPFPPGSQIEFTYETTGIVTNDTKPVSFRNEFRLDGSITPAEVPYVPHTLKLEKIDPDLPSAEQSNHFFHELKNGELKWTLRVYIPEDMRSQDAVLTDALPDHVELTKMRITAGHKLQYGPSVFEFKGSSGKAWVYNPNQQANIIVEAEKNNQGSISVTLPVALTQLGGGYYELELFARIKDSEVQWQTDGMIQSAGFANTASIKAGGTTISDSQTQVITKNQLHGVVSKTGTMTQGSNNVPYSIVVNPEGVDLVKGSQTMVLDDVLEFDSKNGQVHASLVPGSVKVYRRNADGGQGDLIKAPYTYEPDDHAQETEQHRLHITIPDSTPLIVTYSYRFYGTIGVKTNVTNTASIQAVQNDGDQNRNEMEIEVQSSGATADIHGIVLYKVNSADNSEFLQGAEFRLSKWDGAAYRVVQESIKVDSDGRLLLTKEQMKESFAYNTAYKLEETKAPDGYFRAAEPYFFCIEHPDTEANPSCLPDGFTGHHHRDGDLIYFGNEISSTALSIQKSWVDETGKPLAQPGVTEITVKLYRMADGKKEFVQNCTLTAANGWQLTISDLPSHVRNADGTKGAEYRYTIEEVKVPGFSVSYENQDGAASGTIALVNRKEPGYVLPETGGIGIWPLMLAGLGCVVIGGIGLLRRRKSM